MNINSSKFVTQIRPWHANMTEMNHLGHATLIEPEKMLNVWNKLFTASYYSDNSLSTVLGQLGASSNVSKTDWEWDMDAGACRPLVSMGNVNVGVNATQPGRYRQPFIVSLDENFYKPGDVMKPVRGDSKYQVRIQEVPTRKGDKWEYICVHTSDRDDFFIPPALLAQGQPWQKMFANYEEGSEQSGSTVYRTPISLASRLSRYRKTYQVTGDVHRDGALIVMLPGSDGKQHATWISYAEAEYWSQWYKELDLGLWYQRKNDSIKGSTNRPIRTGAGLDQIIMEDGHTATYEHLTTKLLEEFTMDLDYTRLKPGKARDKVIMTGEYGMLNAHRAIDDKFAASGYTKIVDTFSVSRDSSPYHENAWGFGYKFTKFAAPTGGTLTFVHNPAQDDPMLHGEIDPVTGFPKESQKLYFLNLDGKAASQNIKVVKKPNSFSLIYTSGMINPYGNGNKTMASHQGDYYDMHVHIQQGIQVDDPTTLGCLYLGR